MSVQMKPLEAKYTSASKNLFGITKKCSKTGVEKRDKQK